MQRKSLKGIAATEQFKPKRLFKQQKYLAEHQAENLAVKPLKTELLTKLKTSDCASKFNKSATLFTEHGML